MRIPKYLSPSSLTKFYNNRVEFYLQYLCEHRNAKPLQLDYMAAGSGFDAFIKNKIYRDVYGESAVKGTDFEFDTIFEKQVEAHIRTTTLALSGDIWNQYVASGAYQCLLDDILASPFAPQMEFRIESEVQGIPLLGLPDLRYVTPEGIHVICDFKVCGACSKTGASPHQGFRVAWDAHNSKKHGKPHEKYIPMQLKDVEINATYLETVCDYWADQLATYAWLLDEPVGGEGFVVRMEELCMRRSKTHPEPRGRFATHMNRVSELYQLQLFNLYQTAWAAIESGHIFTDLTREASDEKMEMLDARAQTPKSLFPALHRDDASPPRFFQSKSKSK